MKKLQKTEKLKEVLCVVFWSLKKTRKSDEKKKKDGKPKISGSLTKKLLFQVCCSKFVFKLSSLSIARNYFILDFRTLYRYFLNTTWN